MSQLKFYYDLMSQPSRALYMFLKLTNIPFEACPVALRKGEHSSEEFKENLNRFQKVPFIHYGNFKLAESVGIARYLVREFRERIPDHWYPEDSKEQAKVDEYLEWQHTNTRMICAVYVVHKWLLPAMSGSPTDEGVLEHHKSQVLNCLDQIEELWLSQGHPYIVGNKISIADIFAACELEQLNLAGFDCTQGRPKLKSWLEAVRHECNPFYDEAHTQVYRIVNKSKKAKL